MPLGALIVVLVLVDAFEAIVLPRTVRRVGRFSTFWYGFSWSTVRRWELSRDPERRQSRLAVWAALEIPILIVGWAALLILGFALVFCGLHIPLQGEARGLGECLYLSGVTFVTLGYGDVTPTTAPGRFLAVLEAGVGFGLLALVITYVPVFYGSFSRREVTMLRLDARAGSHPSGVEILRRHGDPALYGELGELFGEWDRFAAELLEAYLSYPVLGFYRSQHDEQSWLRSLVAMMDAATLVDLTESDPVLRFRARALFAMGRHLLVDYAYVLRATPIQAARPLSDTERRAHLARLREAGWTVADDAATLYRWQGMVELYEPFAAGLGSRILLELPAWRPDEKPDNWEVSAWDGARHREI